LTSLICLDQTMFDPHTAKLYSVFKVPTCVKWRNVLYLTRLFDSCQQVFDSCQQVFDICFVFNYLSLRKRFVFYLKTFTTLPPFFVFVNLYFQFSSNFS
jgi:hypothetical protein